MNKKLLLAVSVMVAMLLAMLLMARIECKDFVLTDEEGNSTFVEFPYFANAPEKSGTYIYELKGKIYLSIFSSRYYKIIPDDKVLSININGKDVSLASTPEKKKRDVKNGFTVNLSKYLQSGENSVEIKFEDYGGKMGIKVFPLLRDARGIAISLIFYLLLLSFLFLISRKIGLPKRYSVILFLAIAIRILYLSATDYNVREHDVSVHLEYIKYFVENKSFPPLEKAVSGAFFHPPLYYILAALIYSPTSYFTNNNAGAAHFALQIFSLLLSIGFIYFGIKTARLVFACFIKNGSSTILQKILPWVSCLLIAFWPSGIIHSTRIGNDPLLYFSFAAAMYFWISLYLRGKNIHLVWATFYTTIAILTKLNGALLIPMAIVLFLLKGISGHISFSRKTVLGSVFASLIVVAALATTMYPGIALKSEGKRAHIYITNMGSLVIVKNKLENLVWLDVKTFVTEPFTSPIVDKYGRQYFPNYLGKTALFGEWAYSGVAMHNIAVAISILALAIFIISIIFLFKIPIKDLKFLLPILLISILLLCGVTHTRVSFPVNIDFRYILPIIIPFMIFYNYGINLSLLNGKRRFAISALFLELLFCFLSALFILQLWFYSLDSWVIY